MSVLLSWTGYWRLCKRPKSISVGDPWQVWLWQDSCYCYGSQGNKWTYGSKMLCMSQVCMLVFVFNRFCSCLLPLWQTGFRQKHHPSENLFYHPVCSFSCKWSWLLFSHEQFLQEDSFCDRCYWKATQKGQPVLEFYNLRNWLLSFTSELY